MKKFIFVFIVGVLLGGCSSSLQETTPDSIDQKLVALEEALAELKAENKTLKNEVQSEVNTIQAPPTKATNIIEPMECSKGKALSLDGTYCVSVPNNAHATNSPTDVWLCNDGYYESGNNCLNIQHTPTPKTSIEVDQLKEIVDLLDQRNAAEQEETESQEVIKTTAFVNINIPACTKDYEKMRNFIIPDGKAIYRCGVNISFNNPQEIYSVDLSKVVVGYYAQVSIKDYVRTNSFSGDTTNYFFSGKDGAFKQSNLWFTAPDGLLLNAAGGASFSFPITDSLGAQIGIKEIFTSDVTR